VGARLLSVWRWRHRLSGLADWIVGGIVSSVGERVRYRFVRAAPEFQSLERELRAVDEQLREVAPLKNLADFSNFLHDHRPDNLHVNGCGDFQLMAREHWDQLRGYPEFE